MGERSVVREAFVSHSEQETVSFGTDVAARFLRTGSVVALRGELASGKTHFTKGIAAYFGIDAHDISSPTFALANEYSIRLPNGNDSILFHLDCYRFERPEELLELGIEEYLYPDTAITVIEWAERIERYLPETKIDIYFETLSETERQIIITQHFV